MPKNGAYARQVGDRLRFTASELGFPTQHALAAAVGATRGAVDAWYNGRALPPVVYITVLEAWGVTLDWIYKGRLDGLPVELYIRFKGWLEGAHLPEVKPEPESPSAAAVSQSSVPEPAEKRRNRSASVGLNRPAKRATCA